MNFGELVDDVLSATVRPDKETEAKRRVNGAIRAISLSGTYWPDLVEETLSAYASFSSTASVQTLALPARFRKPAYIERDLSAINLTTGVLESRQTHGHLYNRVDPKSTKIEGREITNSYYLSGINILLRQQVAGEAVIWGYYQYPPRFTQLTDTNWIAQLMPDLIVDWASQFVLTALGDKDRIAGVAALTSTQLSIFVDEIMRDSDYNVRSGR